MTTWNPADKSANVTLSNGNLTAIGSTTADGAVRSSNSQSSGSKVYFEVSWVTATGTADTGCGIATSSAALGSIGSSSTGGLMVYTATGNIWFNGSSLSLSVGQVGTRSICFAVDLVNSQIWVRRDSDNWNNSGTANPSTNTGGINISALFPTNNAFAVATFQGTTQQATINFGASAFSFTVPSGFSRWDALVATAINNAGEPREVLFTTNAAATLAGVVREVLTTTPTALTFSGVAREVLLLSPPVTSVWQTAVAVNTG